jgi:uncharacterized protein with von Willebrand factor type A (vWA) domain
MDNGADKKFFFIKGKKTRKKAKRIKKKLHRENGAVNNVVVLMGNKPTWHSLPLATKTVWYMYLRYHAHTKTTLTKTITRIGMRNVTIYRVQ